MMKNIIVIILLLITSINAFSQKEILTNQSIVDMVNYGFQESTIVSIINVSDTNFDLSVSSLKSLKNLGVTENIISSMINKSGTPMLSENKTKQGKIGIYIQEHGLLKKIYPSTFSSSTVNTIGTALTFGLASADLTSSILGSKSHNIVNNNNPEFYFFFTPSSQGGSNIFQIASSPYEFSMIRLVSEDGKRTVRTGSSNAYAGSQLGIDRALVVDIEVTPMSETEFIVKPRVELTPGEYAFFYQGNVSGANNQLVYDFSIIQSVPKYKEGDIVYLKGLLEPIQVKICSVKRSNPSVIYKVKHVETGMEEELYEIECYSTREQANNSTQLNYQELEEKYLQMKHTYEKKIADQQRYIEDLQSIINNLNKQLNN